MSLAAADKFAFFVVIVNVFGGFCRFCFALHICKVTYNINFVVNYKRVDVSFFVLFSLCFGSFEATAKCIVKLRCGLLCFERTTA